MMTYFYNSTRLSEMDAIRVFISSLHRKGMSFADFDCIWTMRAVDEGSRETITEITDGSLEIVLGVH